LRRFQSGRPALFDIELFLPALRILQRAAPSAAMQSESDKNGPPDVYARGLTQPERPAAGSYRSLALQAPHSVQWMKTPCTCPALMCIKRVPQFPQRKSMVSELTSGTGGILRG
jgi:hypothetical protein